MRYVLLAGLLLGLLGVGVAGFRGDRSRRPPLEVFPDMDRQPKLGPQTENGFFPSRMSSLLPPSNTVARAKAFEAALLAAPYNLKTHWPYEDTPVTTGRVTGTTNFIDTNPFQVTESLLARGRQRYQIYCSPCHGAGGDGKGITSKYGMVITRNLHDKLVTVMPDGQVFHVITHGSPSAVMGPYAAQITIADRWAIVAYVRALERGRLAVMNEVPDAQKSALQQK